MLLNKKKHVLRGFQVQFKIVFRTQEQTNTMSLQLDTSAPLFNHME